MIYTIRINRVDERRLTPQQVYSDTATRPKVEGWEEGK